MFDHLHIYATRERLLVGLADMALSPLRWWRRGRPPAAPSRLLILRLERIGDLLMVLNAIATARAAWPTAEVDLAVGSWNAPLARLIQGMNRIDVVDVPWLAREGAGLPWHGLVACANAWRRRRYDLVINFEPDIRSNLLAWLSRAPRRIGYWTGGGGALLTDPLAYDPESHVSVNALALVQHAAGGALPPITSPGLTPDAPAQAAASAALAGALDAPDARVIGLHVSGGRESKQWHLSRFAAVGRALATSETTVVLTGARADRGMADQVRGGLGDVAVIDTVGTLDLPAMAALLARLDLLITGDTGPMHLAAAVGTPVVALFGPSDPRRYGPLAERQRVLRVQLPCSPCGQVRLPPERCRGHVPDCMDGITVDAVVSAARELLAEPRESWSARKGAR